MATEVLLMSDVPNLGGEGEVVSVSDGYARNYLIPKKLGAPVTAAARARLAKLREQRAADLEQARDGAAKLAERLAAVSCTIPVKTGEDEKLYGSVTAADIARVLEQQGVEIDRHKIELEAPIKELGVFDVPVKLHPGVGTTIKVWVVEE
jgi:large subunit ribosomal protein L9